jgi:N-acetylneuraminic acid mutarotase
MGVNVRRTTGTVVLSVAVALAAAGGAQAAFSGVAAVPTGRFDHTTTLLKDGHLLVVGGSNSGELDSVRLYDPTANTWANAASMPDARTGQAAALLHSGKVLVAGGQTATADPASPSGYTRTAELYDPASDTWSSAGTMSTGRFQPEMTVLEDGRVLVTGGTGDVATGGGVNGAVPLASAEIFDPSSGTWSDAASMSVARALHTATLLPSGKVLVAGGYDGAHELASAELYDPADDSWSATDSLAAARDSATATTLPNDEILVAGGDGGAGSALKSAEIYSPDSGTWHGAADMAGARQTAAAALLKDGTVLVTGGEDARQGNALASTERYDPAADTWTDAGALTSARKGHTVTALDDGRAVVVGGTAGGHDVGLASVDRYSAVTTTVTVPAFGTHEVGTSSGVVDAVVKNTGSAPLVVSGVSLAGQADFAIDSETCSAAPVAPGESCSVSLVFTPKAGGARSATLTLADNTAAGTTTVGLNGSGSVPGGGGGANPGGTTPPPASGSTGGSGQPGGSASPTPRQEIKGAKSTSAARATCSVRNARSHGRTRSTVTCRMTWPTRSAVALNAKLMRGRTVVMSTRTTAKSGQAKITMRLNRRLSTGRYSVVITRRDGTAVLRQSLRVR